MAQEKNGFCWECGEALGSGDFGRGDDCPKCGKETRVCRNCRFYDQTAYNECHEPQAERVVEKERANFCDYFEPDPGKKAQQKQKADPMQAANALFKS
ncbi:MAG: hypothetical protein HQL52_18480 [Magnetococcales bacterium]|nr:hypothetical protein [Magnetococcales bacterium]